MDMGSRMRRVMALVAALGSLVFCVQAGASFTQDVWPLATPLFAPHGAAGCVALDGERRA